MMSVGERLAELERRVAQLAGELEAIVEELRYCATDHSGDELATRAMTVLRRGAERSEYLARVLKVPAPQLRPVLHRLVAEGRLRRHGRARGTTYELVDVAPAGSTSAMAV